jgi:hypothetical protein
MFIAYSNLFRSRKKTPARANVFRGWKPKAAPGEKTDARKVNQEAGALYLIEINSQVRVSRLPFEYGSPLVQ